MDKNLKIEEAIFAVARRILDVSKRESYLIEACANDVDLAKRIRELLRAYEVDDRFLETPVERTDALDLAFGECEGVGSVLGAYELVEEIGRGGMGQVFRALQRSPIRREVALKIIRPGLDSRENVERFQWERQALAQLNHHGIAKLLDAGSTSLGRPWFVMELVVGLPITEFCQQTGMSLIDRVRLFLSVCEAMEHAHQCGVIHRDIKPNNVVVTTVNEKPFCKIIDFGVALLREFGSSSSATDERDRDLLDPSQPSAVVRRRANQIIGTPDYMSPEQTTLGDGDLDHRCDVYSLGIVFYELLTDMSPRSASLTRGASLSELRQLLDEAQPVLPSQRVLELRPLKPSAKRLARELQGDLDCVTMKAIASNREDRYTTVSEFASDLRRYLNLEPVSVSRPSTRLRLKAIGRHIPSQWVALYVAGSFVVLAGLAIFFGWLNRGDRTHIAIDKTHTSSEAPQTRTSQALQLRAAYESYFLARVNKHPLPSKEGKPEVGDSSFASRYLERLQESQPIVLKGTAGKVFDVAFSPDSRRLAAGAGNEKFGLDIWDVEKGALERSITDFENDVNFVSFSHDGTKIITADDANRIRIFDVASGVELSRLAGIHQPPACAFLAQDQRTLLVSEIDWQTKDAITSIRDIQDPTYRAEFLGQLLLDVDEDSKSVAMVNLWGTVSIARYPTLEVLSTIHADQRQTVCGKFSPDGSLLATGNMLGQVVVRTTSGSISESLPRYQTVPTAVRDVAFSFDGRLLVETDNQGTLQVWDLESRTLQKVFRTPDQEVWSLAASPNGQWLAAGGTDGHVYLYSMREIQKLRTRVHALKGGLRSLAVDPVSRNYAAIDSLGSLRIYSSQDDALIKSMPAEELPSHEWIHAAYAGNGRSLWLADSHGEVLGIDTETFEVRPSFVTLGVPLEPLIVSHDGNRLGVSTSNTDEKLGQVSSSIWDANTGKEVWRLPRSIKEPGLSPHRVNRFIDNVHIVSLQENCLSRWDISRNTELLPRFEEHDGWIFFSCQVPQQDSLLVGLRDGTVCVWEMHSNRVSQQFHGLRATLNAATFSSDGQTLVTATNIGEVRLWDMRTGLPICDLQGAKGSITHIWFSKDELRLLARVKHKNSDDVMVWDAREF